MNTRIYIDMQCKHWLQCEKCALLTSSILNVFLSAWQSTTAYIKSKEEIETERCFACQPTVMQFRYIYSALWKLYFHATLYLSNTFSLTWYRAKIKLAWCNHSGFIFSMLQIYKKAIFVREWCDSNTLTAHVVCAVKLNQYQLVLHATQC